MTISRRRWNSSIYPQRFIRFSKKPKPPPPTMEEVILDMKMAAKKFERDSKKAEKEKN